MPSQYGELRPTDGWDRLHPSKFQRFSRLVFFTASTSLNWGQPIFARCLAVSWAGTRYIHFQGLLPLTEFCQVQNSLCVCVLLYWQRYCTALEQCESAKLCGIVITPERHFRDFLNSIQQRAPYVFEGRPTRWASAHIVVIFKAQHLFGAFQSRKEQC